MFTIFTLVGSPFWLHVTTAQGWSHLWGGEEAFDRLRVWVQHRALLPIAYTYLFSYVDVQYSNRDKAGFRRSIKLANFIVRLTSA